MSILIIASSQAGVGRSLIAAALAYRFARDGRVVALARLEGDESAPRDASAFAALEYVTARNAAVSSDDLAALGAVGDLIIEAPAGDVKELAEKHGARVIGVGWGAPPELDVAAPMLAGSIVTGVPAANIEGTLRIPGVLAALPEDRALAAPSVRDIAAALKAEWLVENKAAGAIERVMIGTVSSDAASPYFGARERKCVVTRYDKTDIQLAALQTDLEALVLTGGGQPSPYLLDRVAGTRDDLSLLLTQADTVDAMRAIEGLYGRSRFEGQSKLDRAVALLDAAGVVIEL